VAWRGINIAVEPASTLNTGNVRCELTTDVGRICAALPGSQEPP
jgi:hypothetical protein